MAKISAVVCGQPSFAALSPHEASLIINGLARTGTMDMPLLQRLFDAMRRAPQGSWATQDTVRVADALVRLKLMSVPELMGMDLLERVKAELLAAPCGEIGGRGIVYNGTRYTA
jgi:hypothetical protein